MEATSFDLLKALWEFGTVFALMGVVIWALWSEKKELKKENTDLNIYIRDNLVNMLQGVKSSMDKIIDNQVNGDEAVKAAIAAEAARVKDHVTHEITRIEKGRVGHG
jgi:2-hydroxy-3-keto-5-methylthiopentenyl-1-phosphate phosphatase